MARRIDTEANTNWIRLDEQAGDPASPAAGYWYTYIKSDGLYVKDSAGNVTGPIGTGGDVATDDIWDAAGDLVQGTGANTAARLAIGTAYQLLRVNSGATAAEWVSAGRVLINEATPSGTNTVTWDSISAIYNSLEIVFMIRGTSLTANEVCYLYFNNDTTAGNYRYTVIKGYATTSIAVSGADGTKPIEMPSASGVANAAAYGIIRIPYYAGSTFQKMALLDFGYRYDTSSAHYEKLNSGTTWENTSAITRVDIVTVAGNFAAGSTLRLYGVF